MAEQCIRSVHRESCGPQGRPHSPKRFSLVTPIVQVATVLAVRKPTQGDRYGELPEGLPGSESVARRKRGVWNLGGPAVSLARVGWTNPKEGHPMGRGESDRSIVLRGGRADHRGKGATGLHSSQRKHEPDCLFGVLMPTSLRGIAINAEASSPEEPGAGIPHAGICEGAVR